MENLPESGAPRRSGVSTWVLRGVIAAGVGAIVVLHLVVPDGLVGEASYLGVLIGAAILAFVGALRRPRAVRSPWVWVAVGVGLSALGDLSYSVYVHVRGFDPDVSIADVPWLASYLAISIGLVMLLRATRRGDGSDVDGLIDMAVVAVVSLLVVWQVVLEATVADTSVAAGVRAVWGSYPILDAALLALVVRMAVSRTPGALLLGAGVVCWLFSDFFYMLFPTATAWLIWLDAGWMLGAALLAAATWERSRRAAVVRPRESIGAVRVALTIAPMFVPVAIEVVAHSRGTELDPIPMLLASVALASLVYFRALRLLRSSHRAETELRVAEQFFRAMVQRSSDAAMVMDHEFRVLYMSPAVSDQFGYPVDALVGRSGWDLVHPDDVQRCMETYGPVVESPGAHISAEFRLLDAGGQWRWVEGVVTNLIDEPAVGGLVINVRDISERKAAEVELSRMAHFDALTGLANRWLLTEQLDEALADGSVSTALLVVDLDQFKFVNDSRGHAVGDQLLVSVANNLRTALPSTDVIGRIGGDEFGVVCRGVADVPGAQARARLVERALSAPVDLQDDGVFFATASVGIAVATPESTSELLLQQADTAMYAAKRQGTAQSVVFDERLRRGAEEQLTVQAELRSALHNRELVVHYQPVVNLVTGCMDGVEALVRWRHPQRGLVMPGDFIPIAERSDLIDGISAFVLEQACADASWWARAGHPLSVAVNISGVQLRHEHVAATIQEALYNSGLGAGSLVLEITETALMLGAERALENIDAIRALGVRIALDDFGTGYSSLSYLKRVPADIVKIDRSFVTGIADDSVDHDIAAAIIHLARALGRSVVAEGVETDAQHAALRQLGCPLAQGFLWSRAVAAEEILPLRRVGALHPRSDPVTLVR